MTNAALFQLPAGPVGFAAVAEYGEQGYDLKPDPLALTDYYYSWKDSDGKGERKHGAVGAEARMLQYDFSHHLRGSLTVRNLFDTIPVKDQTWTSYPYYNTSWYDSIGRDVVVQLTYRLGGEGF